MSAVTIQGSKPAATNSQPTAPKQETDKLTIFAHGLVDKMFKIYCSGLQTDQTSRQLPVLVLHDQRVGVGIEYYPNQNIIEQALDDVARSYKLAGSWKDLDVDAQCKNLKPKQKELFQVLYHRVTSIWNNLDRVGYSDGIAFGRIAALMTFQKILFVEKLSKTLCLASVKNLVKK